MALRGARIHVSWQAVVAFVVVLLFAAVVFAVRVVRAEQTSTSRPVGAATPAGVVGRSVPSAFATTGVTRPVILNRRAIAISNPSLPGQPA